jgi:hypothetical protein
MTSNGHAPILDGCAVLPPMDPPRETPSRCRAGKASKPKGKPGDRFAVLNAFVDFALSALSRRDIAVWLVLYRDTRDGTARTSYDDLARRAGLNRRNVARAVRRLEQLGLLKVVYRGGLRRGPSRYRVRALPKDG